MPSLRLAALALLLSIASVARADGVDPQLQAAFDQCPVAAEYMRAHPQPPATATTPSPTLPQLRDELLWMEHDDQAARDFDDWSDQAAIRHMLEVDAAHLPRIRAIVASHGFPTPAQVGSDGAAAAWLLVQHADADPAFQGEVLEAIRPRLGQGDISAKQFALLTDRVLVGQDKPQRYGSQLEPGAAGQWVPKRIEAADAVDLRRAGIGLMPLAGYICVAAMLYGPAPAGGQ